MIKYMSITPEKLAFLARLNEVVAMLDYPERGKQTQLAARYNVTQGACRKWFAGEAMPSYEICLDLCKRAKVTYEWLMTGRGQKLLATSSVVTIEERPAELQWLSGDEAEMLSIYRSIEESSRETLKVIANSLPKSQAKSVIGDKS